MLAGTLEKRIGEKSGRQSLPEAWKWQKRYFVLSEPQGKLYYFKSADDPPNYKGLIDMRDCKAEDVDIDGLPRNASKSKYDLDGGGGQVSLLIRISHKVCRWLTGRLLRLLLRAPPKPTNPSLPCAHVKRV